jgi:LacI family transcriptional regulator
MTKKKISITDIARQLNISITTVSFILNGKAKEKHISESLTKKVLDFVEEIGYKPNQLAQSLRTGKTKIIGFMVEDISNPFFANIARMIEGKAFDRGYKLIYCSTENNTDKARELIKIFRDRHLDGYIITPPAGIEEDIKSLMDEKLPVILFDRYFPDLKTSYVVVDNFGGTYKAINHLIEKEHRNIAIVTIQSEQTQMLERLSGYEEALNEHGLKHFVFKATFGEDSEDTIRQIISFLEGNPEIDAVFFATNYLAVSGIEAIDRLGLSIPEDIGVIAFDDNEIFRLNKPAITAIAQPIEEISKQLIDIILKNLDENYNSVNTQSIILPTKLILRKSTR